MVVIDLVDVICTLVNLLDVQSGPSRLSLFLLLWDFAGFKVRLVLGLLPAGRSVSVSVSVDLPSLFSPLGLFFLFFFLFLLFPSELLVKDSGSVLDNSAPMEVYQDDKNDDGKRNETEYVLFATPLLVPEGLVEDVTDQTEEHHQRFDEEGRKSHFIVELVAGWVDASPVGKDEPREVWKGDSVEQQDIVSAFFVLPVATALAHAAVNIILAHEGLVKLVELLLLANKDDLFKYLYSFLSLCFLFELSFLRFRFLLLFGLFLFLPILFFLFLMVIFPSLFSPLIALFRPMGLGTLDSLSFYLGAVGVGLSADFTEVFLARLVPNLALGLATAFLSLCLHLLLIKII